MVGCWSGSCGVLKVVSGWRIPRLASSRTPNSWVGELLTRIGPGGVHGGRDAIGHDLAVRAVLGPARDRVAQLLAGPRPRRPPPHRAGTADRAGCRTSGSRTSPQPRDPAQPGGQQRPSRVPFHRLGTRSPAAPTGPWTSGNQPAASPRRDDLLASKLPAPRLGALASAPLDRTDPALLTTRATAFARAAWFRITRCGG
jgi:hypothetical protein